MSLFKTMAMCGVVAGLGLQVYADNPISNYHYLADPAAFSVDDRFFIICDTDDESGDDGYTIKAYYAFSSKDMKNWTDHGEVFRVPDDVSWASNAWAPGAVSLNGKIYVYFPNGASGVGVVVADDIAGPYKDPVGKQLVGGWGTSAGAVDCDGIAWCFDPGIFVDDDGKAYLTFGGGKNDARPYGSNFTMYELNSDMVSLKTSSKTRITGTTGSFEASYIHKYDGKYYFSYSTNDLKIGYAMSSNVASGYVYKGVFMANPNINGTNINANNNNHHGIAEFNGRWYVAYHDRRLVNASEHPSSLGKANPAAAYHRSLSIDEFYYDTDGTMKSLTFTNEGPAQIANFDPYDSIPALTSSLQKNIYSRTEKSKTAPAVSLLVPKGTKESWIRVSGVDFGGGATKFIVNASSLNGNNKVEIRTGTASGTLAGTCVLENTGSWSKYATVECDVTGLKGVVDQVFLKFTGTSDSTAALRWWEFSGAASVPQSPYGGVAADIPGKIEMENYDEGGTRNAYSDDDSENKGDASFRSEEGVDVVSIDSGKAVGYTVAGEWLEYTVNVTAAGEQPFTARVSSGSDASSFRLLMDDVVITDTVKIPQGENWETYTTVTGKTNALTVGEHILKLQITGSYVNIDWIYFGEGPSAIKNLNLRVSESESVFSVYTVQGKIVGQFRASEKSNLTQKTQMIVRKPGVYLVKPENGGKVYHVFVSKVDK